MPSILVLDTGVLGLATHPFAVPEFMDWLEVAERQSIVVVPAVCDYESRRELIRRGGQASLARLDEFVSRVRYEDMDFERWQIAARLWAAARNRGRPTADLKSLDIDVLVAAIAVSLESEGDVVVATSNARHLAQFVDARVWSDITFPGDARTYFAFGLMLFWPRGAPEFPAPLTEGGGPPAPLNPDAVFFLLVGLVFATVVDSLVQ